MARTFSKPTDKVLLARAVAQVAASGTVVVKPCTSTFSKATSFKELIDLVCAAESKLSAAGITSAQDQIHALRGLFYGTVWSTDYAVGGSALRNEGFQRFTRPSMDPSTSVPPDVRSFLDCGLADALKQSQDCIDPSGRQIDFGHLIIGLDARYDPQATTRIFYPYSILGITKTVDMGGNGTELVTWLGDLGGGAAMLSVLRAATPSTNAREVFCGHPPTWTTSDYGGSINLEGDIAGFMINPFIGPVLPSASIPPPPGGKNLCDALQDYLSPPSGGAAWNSRATIFLTTYGANFDSAGNLTNRGALIGSFAAKIQIFACNYLASRVKDKKLAYATAKAAADYVIPSSEEVAEAFVDALDDSHRSGGQIEAKKFPSPKPAQPGACGLQIAAGGLISIF